VPRPSRAALRRPTLAESLTVAEFDVLSTSVIVTVIVYGPSSLYVWLPVTSKLPALPPMVPVVVVPSPQSIVAEYSLGVEPESGSVNVATVVPANDCPSVALTTWPFAEIG
jgi:hypothetical protein